MAGTIGRCFRALARLPFAAGATKGERLIQGKPESVQDFKLRRFAGVAELVDALVLGTSIERCGGSSPFARTTRRLLDAGYDDRL